MRFHCGIHTKTHAGPHEFVCQKSSGDYMRNRKHGLTLKTGTEKPRVRRGENFLFLIGVYLTYSVVLASDVQQNDSVKRIDLFFSIID